MKGMFDWIVSAPYAYPLLEVLHIVGISLLVGNLVLFELRVWGFGVQLPVQALANLALRLSLIGFGVIVASGLLMFAGQPRELMDNTAFAVKMVLVMCAGVNASVFHARGGVQRLDGTARLQTALSMGLWLGVIICGRWIAYQ
jgi:hypothetical protein